MAPDVIIGASFTSLMVMVTTCSVKPVSVAPEPNGSVAVTLTVVVVVGLQGLISIQRRSRAPTVICPVAASML